MSAPIPAGMPAVPPQANPVQQQQVNHAPQNQPGQAEGGFQDHMNAQGVNAAQQAQNPAAVATQKVTEAQKAEGVQKVRFSEGNDPFIQLNELRGEFDQIRDRSRKMEEKIASGEMKADDPKVQQVRRQEMFDYMDIQMRIQRATFNVELVSKVVEHGTTGVKTVLQTQA